MPTPKGSNSVNKIKAKSKALEDDISDPSDRLLIEIKSDSRFIRTQELVNELLGDVDINELHDEVAGYLKERGDRPPLALVKNPNKYLVRYASQDASLRSRISYIQSTCRRVYNKVSYLLDSFHDWILATYGNRLKGTVQIKNAVVSDLTYKMRSKMVNMESLDDCCAIALADIDQGQWQRKAIISVLEIEASPEGKL